jgi:LPS export ABC transporter protein LptC
MVLKKIFITIFLLGLLIQCQKPKNSKIIEKYQGPIVEGTDINSLLTDSAKKKVILKAPLRLEYQSGDQDYPKGIDIDFFDDKGQYKGKLTAETAHYDKIRKQYTGRGNVVVDNIQEKRRLTTEELHWTPENQMVFTAPDMFVTIKTVKEIIKGFGLNAKQDLSKYELLKPTGIISLQ